MDWDQPVPPHGSKGCHGVGGRACSVLPACATAQHSLVSHACIGACVCAYVFVLHASEPLREYSTPVAVDGHTGMQGVGGETGDTAGDIINLKNEVSSCRLQFNGINYVTYQSYILM